MMYQKSMVITFCMVSFVLTACMAFHFPHKIRFAKFDR